jgi:outer membrane protein OmpA-like peptidoglycan-associated protein
MKKLVLGIAILGLAIGCKKVPAGGNHGVLKRDAGVEHYSDIVQGDGAGSHAEAGETVAKNAIKVEVNGNQLNAFQGGLEEQMVSFLKTDGYKNAADDAVLKDKWYNFDNVVFKTGSANQLEQGAEQLKNLAAILKAYPDAKLKVGGYTDKTGDEAVNKKISTQRAEFIKSELSKLGVGAQVISAEGYGSQYAKVDAKASDAERAVDRKMAVRFTK